MLHFGWSYGYEDEDLNHGGFVPNKHQKKRHWRKDNENIRYIRNCVKAKLGRCSCEWCSCIRKTGKYQTQTEAAQAAIDINHFRCIKYAEVYPYKCRYCSYWHIGHSNRGLDIVA